MFDLRVGPINAPEMAIEVTSAIDQQWTETWNVGQRRSGNVPGVLGDWMLVVRPGANVKRIKNELPDLVTAINAAGLGTVHEEDLFHAPQLRAYFSRLGIMSAYRVARPGSGNVEFILDSDGGVADSTGQSVPGWIGQFLSDAARADVLRKLTQTTAPQREVFIIADLEGPPWSVMSYLTDISRRVSPIPPSAPNLPAPVTGVWLAATFSFGDWRGIRWDGTRWAVFRDRDDDDQND